MNELRLFIVTTYIGTPRRFLCEYAAFLADFAVFFFFAHRLFKKRKWSFPAVNICALGGAALFSIVGLPVRSLVPIMGAFYNLLELVFLLGSLFLIYKDKLSFKAAYTLMSLVIYAASDIFVINLMLLCNGDAHNAVYYGLDASGSYTLLHCVLLRLIRLAAMAFLYRFIKRSAVVGGERSVGMLNYIAIILFCGTVLFGIFTVAEYSDHDMNLARSLAALAIMIAALLIVRFMPKLSGLLRTDESGELSSFETRAPDTGGLSPRDMQKLRHDVKNNAATISALIDSGNGEEAKRLLSELAERLGNALGGGNKTNVSAIDSVISEKAKLCGERGVTLDMHAEPLPETKISPLDLSSAISNILDNAIEAAEKCEEPVITFRVFKYKSYLAVTCENPTAVPPRVVNGALATTKGGGHGYGLEIIGEICKKNNGRFQYEFDNKVFKASAFLEL